MAENSSIPVRRLPAESGNVGDVLCQHPLTGECKWFSGELVDQLEQEVTNFATDLALKMLWKEK